MSAAGMLKTGWRVKSSSKTRVMKGIALLEPRLKMTGTKIPLWKAKGEGEGAAALRQPGAG